MKQFIVFLVCAMLLPGLLRAQEEEETNVEETNNEISAPEAPAARPVRRTQHPYRPGTGATPPSQIAESPEHAADDGTDASMRTVVADGARTNPSPGYSCLHVGGLQGSYDSIESIVADAQRLKFSHAITVDGRQVYPGFGPAAPCRSAGAPGGDVKDGVEGSRRDGDDAVPGGGRCSQAKARADAVERGLVANGNRDRETEWQVRRSLAHHATDRYLYDNPASACAYEEALAAQREAEDAWMRYVGVQRPSKPGSPPLCPPRAVPMDRKSRSRCRGSY